MTTSFHVPPFQNSFHLPPFQHDWCLVTQPVVEAVAVQAEVAVWEAEVAWVAVVVVVVAMEHHWTLNAFQHLKPNPNLLNEAWKRQGRHDRQSSGAEALPHDAQCCLHRGCHD